jgi:spore coat polysaccharide biosynthesis predicted glycosyltransferase SpsG
LEIVTRADGNFKLGADFLSRYPYQIRTIQAESDFFLLLDEVQPDLVILDVLDTDAEYMAAVKSRAQKVVSLEDLGPGASQADIIINDLYTDLYPQTNHWYGVQNAILGPQFEMIEPRPFNGGAVETILIAFGGTDPQNLTIKALKALAQLSFSKSVIVVLGPGYQHAPFELADYGLQGQILRSVSNMPHLMQQADLALTSGGRTVTELMTVGVPTLVLCQNTRELTHTHASSPYGIINLGLGEHVDVHSLSSHISLLLADPGLLESMRNRALQAVRDRSNKVIVERIMNTLLE